MIERVRSFVDAYQLNNVETKLLVGVSGGMDSIVLVDLLKRLRCNFSIAHMNYGLRGNDSDEDEKFVQTFAESHGIQFHLQCVDMTDLNGESIQMVARTKRYTWFNELVSKYRYDFILTAHHLNDSFETTLLNLTKGTGIKGLTGISGQNDKILRPLINVSKEVIHEYAVQRNLAWREDVSNTESKYLRNKIRNQVIPVLNEMNPSLLETFRNTNERLIGVSQLLDQEVVRINQNHMKSVDGVIELDLSWYDSDPMHDVLLSEILKPYGASYIQSKEIGRAISVGAIFFTDGYQFNVDRIKLLISRREIGQIPALTIKEPGIVEWGNLMVQVESSDDLNFAPGNEDSSSFDRARIAFPLTIRCWEEGDVFVPLGMKGKKKVSDFMIDNKIPLTLKKSIPLFVTRKDIFWVGGHRIDDRFKITEHTKEVLKIKISRRD
jgi:tRNA(Ile)-lysidine synthase